MTYEEYYNQWQLSVESRDLAFDEWLCLMLDKQKAIDDEEQGKALLYCTNKTAERVKREMIDKTCELLTNMGVTLLYTNKEGVFCVYNIDNFRKSMEE